MFPLFTDRMPSNAADLQRALNATIERLFAGVTNPVSVRDKNYPQLAALEVELNGAELRPNALRPPTISGATKPALEVAELNLSANEVSIGPAALNLQIHARDVQLHEAHDAKKEIVLVLQSAADGRIAISASKSDLEDALGALARDQAGKQGITVDQVELALNSRGDRGVDAEVRLRAKKMFFTTTVRIGAKLDLDDELNARLSGLSCKGEGAIGAVACGVLQPHIEKLDGRAFSLMALPLGEVRLRDVRIVTGDQTKITAEFGA